MKKHKVIIFHRMIFKIIKQPEQNNGLYLIGRTGIKDGLQHYSEAEIPKDKIIEIKILKVKT